MARWDLRFEDPYVQVRPYYNVKFPYIEHLDIGKGFPQQLSEEPSFIIQSAQFDEASP